LCVGARFAIACCGAGLRCVEASQRGPERGVKEASFRAQRACCGAGLRCVEVPRLVLSTEVHG
jgi:hypothetical protein